MKKLFCVIAVAVISTNACAANSLSAKDFDNGKELFFDKSKPLACADCHGGEAEGNQATRKMREFPALAGQDEEATISALHAYANGDIQDGLTGMMRATRKMSDADIKAIAAYLATLKKP